MQAHLATTTDQASEKSAVRVGNRVTRKIDTVSTGAARSAADAVHCFVARSLAPCGSQAVLYQADKSGFPI